MVLYIIPLLIRQEKYQKNGKWESRGIQHWLGVYLEPAESWRGWILTISKTVTEGLMVFK